MLRIIARVGVVAALVAVALAPGARAAPVTFDVAGHATLNTATIYEPPPGYVIVPALAPSTVDLDIDPSGGNVTLIGASLSFHQVTSLNALGSITSDELLTFPGGAHGTLAGNQILWDGDPVYASLTGTFSCTGPLCGLLGLPPGVILPLGELASVYNVWLPVSEPIDLGTWLLSSDLARITGSTRMVTAAGHVEGEFPGPGVPNRWLVLGDTDLGFVPEPDGVALLLVALGAIAAAQRAVTAR
jgi:hypothetical protein